MTKEYKNKEQQIKYLIENKNIDPLTLSTELFEYRSYVSLVNPYKEFVCKNKIGETHIYDDPTDFSLFLNIAYIDDFISSRLNLYINAFEKHLKSFIASVYSEKMNKVSRNCDDYATWELIKASGSTNLSLKIFHDCLPIGNDYDKKFTLICAEEEVISKRISVVSTILKLSSTTTSSKNIIVNHYKANHFPVPFWIVVHELYLGDLLVLLGMLPIKEQVAFCEKLSNKTLNYNEARSMITRMTCIKNMRNIINHYEPIVPYFLGCVNDNSLEQVKKSIQLLMIHYENSPLKNIEIKPLKDFILRENDYTRKRINMLKDILGVI